MNGKLLDTNAIIALQSSDPNFVVWMEQKTTIYIPVIAIGELVYGAWNSTRSQRNLNNLKILIENNRILDCTARTAYLYGEIRYQLKSKGRPIPINDIWIAAMAIEHSLVLVTRDHHFRNIDQLPIESW